MMLHYKLGVQNGPIPQIRYIPNNGDPRLKSLVFYFIHVRYIIQEFFKNFYFSNFGPTRGIQRSTYKRMKKPNKEDMTYFVI